MTDNNRFEDLQGQFAELQTRFSALAAENDALREREERFRLMAETIAEVFWMSTPGIGQMLYVSPGYEKIWGRSRESLYRSPQDFLTAIHPDDQQQVREAVVSDHADGKWRCEYRIRRPDGGVRWIHDHGFPVYSPDGTLRCMTGVARDITSQKEMEEALRHSNQMFENIFSSIHIHIAYLDPDFRFIRVNTAYAAAAGYEATFFEGKGHFELFPNEENERIFRQTCKSGQPCFALEKAFDYPDQPERGTTYWDWSLIPLKKEDGRVYGLLLTLVDVTERAKNRQALEQALAAARDLAEELRLKNRDLKKNSDRLRRTQEQIIEQEKLATIGQLTAGIAHEINNPLSFVASNLSALGKYFIRLREYLEAQEVVLAGLDEKDPALIELAELRRRLKLEHILADGDDLIDESLDGAKRLKSIVLDLKSFSRREDGDMARVDINTCLKSTLNMVWNELKYKCQVVKELGGDLPPVLCHSQQINQVFMNLLVNAGHAIEEHGTITVRSWQEGEAIKVAISDTGSGIAPDVAARIFDPFFTTKKAGKGTGLGLSISMDIVRAHGGDLKVDSEPGRGTTFTLQLPIDSATEAPGR